MCPVSCLKSALTFSYLIIFSKVQVLDMQCRANSCVAFCWSKNQIQTSSSINVISTRHNWCMCTCVLSFHISSCSIYIMCSVVVTACRLLVGPCVMKLVFVCVWHLTTIHLSICCEVSYRLWLRLLSDGGSDAELISCSLTAPACSILLPREKN